MQEVNLTIDVHAKGSLIDPSIPSLADALEALVARKDVPTKRRVRVRSAVNTLARLLRREAADIPAHLPQLMRHLRNYASAPDVISKRHLANIKTELRFLIKTICGRQARSPLKSLTPPWVAFRALIQNNPIHWNLSRFMAFCSANSIDPQNVDDAAAGAFLECLVTNGDVPDPNRHFRATLRAWNKACATVPGWPGSALKMPPRKRARWTLPPTAFPAAFQAEVECWIARLTKADPLAEEGPRTALAPETIKLRRHQIYKAASALTMSGIDVDEIMSLATIVEPDSFRALLRVLLDRQNGVPTEALFRLAGALIAVARHQVELPSDKLTRLLRIARGLAPKDKGAGRRTLQRLEPFEDDRMLGALLHLSEPLLRAAQRAKHPRERRLLAQVAIAVELELMTPLRRKNLAGLNLDQHVQIVQKGRERVWILRIEKSETKNRSRLTHEIGADSVRRIERGLSLYQQTNGWLFPGRDGRPKDPSTLSAQIKRAVETRLGVPFNIHLFRALEASLHLKENPNGFESVRALLGDRDDRVIRASYTQFAERSLIAAAQQTILNHRARIAPCPPAKARRGKG